MNNTAPQGIDTAGPLNVFKPIKIGEDLEQSGSAVLTLAGKGGMVTGPPGSGKTNVLNIITLAMALDPRVELHVFENRGEGPLATAARSVAHTYYAGPDASSRNKALPALRRIAATLTRRRRTLDNLKQEHVTDGLASDPALGLHPIGIVVDDCQVWFNPNTTGAASFTEVCIQLATDGAPLGVMPWFAVNGQLTAIPAELVDNLTIQHALIGG